jgi:signal transduction histidine kinase
LMRARLDTVLDDLAHLWSDPQEEWGRIDVTPGFQRAWRLATLGVPAEVTRHQEFLSLPPVWGSAARLSLAGLYLLAFAVDLLPPTGELGIKAEPSPAGGVRLAVWVSGDRHSPDACQKWLNPFGEGGKIQGSLGPALAAAIASQHGGSLAVVPREQGGAVFTLELPPLTASLEPHEPVI